MPVTAIGNLRSCLDRAIVAYLISAGAGTADDVYELHRSFDKELPNTTVKAFSGTESPTNSGSELFRVEITVKFPAAVQPGQGNPRMNQVECDKRVGLTMSAMSQTNDGESRAKVAADITDAGRALYASDPINDWDMQNFTCESVYYLGCSAGQDEEGVFFAEVRNFEIRACLSDVD